jgi:hypothetical protein
MTIAVNSYYPVPQAGTGKTKVSASLITFTLKMLPQK